MLFFLIIFFVLKDVESHFVFDLADIPLIFGDCLSEVVILVGKVGYSILQNFYGIFLCGQLFFYVLLF